MWDYIVIIVVVGIVYIAQTVNEINKRITILDLRHRVIEALLGFPRGDRYEQLSSLYDKYFGDMYVGDYDRIVKFGRKHDLKLPLKLMKEIELEIEKTRK